MLPSDPFMLLSVVNTKLRDEFDSLNELCRSLDVDRDDIVNPLAAIGFVYNPVLNQFK
ncbi:MAG: DUF4250 domain-containing protein [Muribaculaceae bacterium]|nr:DUF4250 domain-containing protein [Muribaculaceae bacterium]